MQLVPFLHRLLARPAVYSALETTLGALRMRRMVVRGYARPQPGERILDIGCGPGDVLESIPVGAVYIGFDSNPDYIRAARERYGQRATFHCELVGDEQLASVRGDAFDLVLALGVLHHLADPEAGELFRLAASALRPGGRLITLDGCYAPGQSPVARWLLGKDRGKFARRQEEYCRLANHHFTDVTPTLRHDLLRIPYTLLVLECRLPRLDHP